MGFKKMTAIVRMECLERVEDRLRSLGIKGVSVSQVKGYGEHANFFRGDWCTPHARLEVFADESDVQPIVNAIMEAAHTGVSGDGIIVVLPVESAYRIREQRAIKPGEVL